MMAKKFSAKLPATLKFLQPFVDSLLKLALDDLNEDVDPATLIQILRQRYQNLDAGATLAHLRQDRKLLEEWLHSNEDRRHPAYWIMGFMQGRGLTRELMRSERAPETFRIDIEPPSNWNIWREARQLFAQNRKLHCTFTHLDKETANSLKHELESQSPEIRQTSRIDDVQFGEVLGKKFAYEISTPNLATTFKYVLSIPNGNLLVQIEHAQSKPFDATEYEKYFHTLRITTI